jgi:predicted peptidase
MKKQGVDVRLTVYPEAGHDSWTASYANPQLYEWLLQQHRNAK